MSKTIVYMSRLTRFDYNGCYLNSAICFLDRGYHVVFCFAKYSGECLQFSKRITNDVEIIPVIYRWKLVRLIGVLSKSSKLIRKYGYFFYYVLISFFKLFHVKTGTILIPTDSPSLLVAWLVSKIKNIRIVYFPQELYLEEDAGIVYPLYWSKIEARLAKRVYLTVAFDRLRGSMYAERRGIDGGRMVIVPNSRKSEQRQVCRNYWREKYGFGSEIKIIMFSGGVEADYNCLDTILKILTAWPKNWRLVIYSLSSSMENARLADTLYRCNLNDRVYLERGGESAYDDISYKYAGADVGLAVYGKQTKNHWYAGLSAGKMWNFLSVGVPVIVNRTEVMKECIEDACVGRCIESIAELPEAIDRILAAADDEMRTRCCDVHQNWRYDDAHKLLEDFLS